jgi:L-arabinose 1- dehydrogenase
MMRTGIVGLGAIAPYFLRAIEADPVARLAAVCDRDKGKLTSIGQDVLAATDYREMLHGGEIDALIVSLPNHAHFEVVSAALLAGIHVCCEKPLTTRASEADRLRLLSRETGTTLFTAFHRRYNRNIMRLARALPPPDQIAEVVCRYEENIREHTGGESWYLDPEQCGGGCLVDNGPNALDVLRTLLGDLTLLDSTIADVREGTEYEARLSLRSRDGVSAHVLLNWALPTGEVKDVTVRLRDGSLLTADMLAGFAGFKSSLDHEYAAIVADFRRAIATGNEHGDDGAAITALVEHAYGLAGGERPGESPRQRP